MKLQIVAAILLITILSPKRSSAEQLFALDVETPVEEAVADVETPVEEAVADVETPVKEAVGDHETPFEEAVGVFLHPAGGGFAPVFLHPAGGGFAPDVETPVKEAVGDHETPFEEAVGEFMNRGPRFVGHSQRFNGEMICGLRIRNY
ncbi:unnamed protein product [Natator depressus]